MKKYFLFSVIILNIVCLAFSVQKVSAYTVEKFNFENMGDIVVGPGKTELVMDPGQTSTQSIIVSNRAGGPRIINISVEDFQGSKDLSQTIEFLGNKNGPYSLKDYVKPEVNQVTLQFGERLTLPITISLPKGISPGGLYGAVMVSAANVEQANANLQTDTAAGKVKIITRVASLFFITIRGPVIANGDLKSFKTTKSFYESGPVDFQIISENNGSIYLSPYGTVEIKNMLGQKIDERQVDPWFVLPGAVRQRDILWNSNFLFGRYTATLSMNRGYQNIIDTKSFSFWVIPWRILSIILIGLILVIWFFIWIFSHIQWKGKPSNPAMPRNSNPPVAPPLPPTQNMGVPPPSPR